jgi:hypothetical protein
MTGVCDWAGLSLRTYTLTHQRGMFTQTHRRLHPFRSSSSGSGRLPIASIAQTQRLRFLLLTSSPGPYVAESRSPIQTPVAPCPRSAIRSEVYTSVYSSVDESF